MYCLPTAFGGEIVYLPLQNEREETFTKSCYPIYFWSALWYNTINNSNFAKEARIMKKILLTCLAAACILAICACQKKPQEPLDTENPYFTGKVIEILDKGCLMEVTHSGNGTFPIGEKIIVNTNIENCPKFGVGDHLRISFDGKVALSYPGQVLNVYSVTKTDANGNP